MVALSHRLQALALTGSERWFLLNRLYKSPDGRLYKLLKWPAPQLEDVPVRSEASLAKNKEWQANRRAANIAAGLQWNGKPRRRPADAQTAETTKAVRQGIARQRAARL